MRSYRLKRGSAAELEEAIAAADPARASDSVADRPLQRALRGDLDAILNKALKEQPEARYASVAEFAEDLRRQREGEPVPAPGVDGLALHPLHRQVGPALRVHPRRRTAWRCGVGQRSQDVTLARAIGCGLEGIGKGRTCTS